MELIVAIAALVVGLLAYQVSYIQLDGAKRSEFKKKAWIQLEISFALLFSGYAAYVILSFWTQQTPPTRSEIMLVIWHSFIFVWGPKSIVDGHFQRRSNARLKAQTARLTASTERMAEKGAPKKAQEAPPV